MFVVIVGSVELWKRGFAYLKKAYIYGSQLLGPLYIGTKTPSMIHTPIVSPFWIDLLLRRTLR